MSNPTVNSFRNRGRIRAQGGFTLVELMVATTIAVFLLAGLFASLQSTRSAYRNQSSLAEMQDNERLVMNLMADVIESAGYYPDPKLNSADTVLPISGVFAGLDQAIFGTFAAAAPGDTVTVRFGAGLGDNVFNCAGQQNTATAPFDTFINRFFIAPAANDATTNALWCTATTAAGAQNVQLVNGVDNLVIWYGVQKTIPSTTGTCTETYLRANQMAAADWLHVCAVRVSVTFRNRMQGNNNATAAPPVTISRIITLMNAAGVNT